MLPKAYLKPPKHICSRTLKNGLPNAKFIIAKFKENSRRIEIAKKEDLRKLNKTTMQDDANPAIKKNLPVNKHIIDREGSQIVDLLRSPPDS